MSDHYKILWEGGQGELVEKKSRFIATTEPVETEEEALAFIERTRKKYWDARHNCSAFIIGSRGELTRCSDDGEPSGTAGRPMLEVLTDPVSAYCGGSDQIFWWHIARHRRPGAGLYPGGEGGAGSL